MGSDCNSSRRHYDISMSKRTRRSLINIENAFTDQMTSNWQNEEFVVLGAEKEVGGGHVNVGDEETDGESFLEREQVFVALDSPEKQVLDEFEWTSPRELTMNVGDEEEKEEEKREEEGKKREGEVKTGRSSLGQHFTEEEKMQVVVRKKKQEGGEGIKLKGLVRRYAKVLTHLIRNKAYKGSRNKPLLQLTM